MLEDERLADELEALKAILLDEIVVKLDDSGRAVCVETDVVPWTALDATQQYVRVTLVVELPPRYPDIPPSLQLRNPRGLDDGALQTILREARRKCHDCAGQPIIFEIIELVKEHLTESNLPCCQCCICLYGFRDGDHFTKTQCYHYFHSHCLAGHLTASERIFREEQDKLPRWQRTQSFQAVCPVCRAALDYDVATLATAPPPLDVADAPRTFEPTPELRRLQQQMAALLLHQKRRGGTIREDSGLLLLTQDEDSSGGTNR